MKGDLFINGYDAYARYGVSLEQGGLTALMTPAPMKDLIESRRRREHGKRVVNDTPRYDDRDITLPLHLTARDTEDFLRKYSLFCSEVLAKGRMEISTRYESGVVYRCDYVNCTQFSEFRTVYAAFSLRLNEPDPTNRGLTDKNDGDNGI